MLVLSRRVGETIELPEVGVVVQVVGIKKSKIQLGIEAPREITVSRGELPRRRQLAAQPEREQMLAELARLEAEVLAMTELASPANQQTALAVRDETATRIDSLRRSLQLHSSASPRSIAELVTVRADVIEQLRLGQIDQQRRADTVRQSSAGYTVVTPACGVA